MPDKTEYARMASGAYDVYSEGSDPKEFFDLGTGIPGWQPVVIEDLDVSSIGLTIDENGYIEGPDGFAARVYRNTDDDEIVVAFRGTEGLSWSDWSNNFQFVIQGSMDQAALADELTNLVINTFPQDDVSFTGHSLGGGLAAFMAVRYDKEATVFDPAPYGYFLDEIVQGALFGTENFVVDNLEAYQRATANIKNVYTEGEILSTAVAELTYPTALALFQQLNVLDASETISDLLRTPFPAQSEDELSFDNQGLAASVVDLLSAVDAIGLHSADLLAALAVREDDPNALNVVARTGSFTRSDVAAGGTTRNVWMRKRWRRGLLALPMSSARRRRTAPAMLAA
jgi:predicted esterase YcpF (UPF0227 family)